MNRKKATLIFLLLWPVVSAFVLYALRAPAIFSVVCFFAIPSLVIALQSRLAVTLKQLLFSFILGVPGIIVIDYIANLTDQWHEPVTIFPFRLFDFVSIEVVLWAVGNVLLVLAFYTFFFEKRVNRQLLRPRMRRLTAWFGGVFALFAILYAAGSSWLNIPYFYAFFGTTLILIPVCLVLYRHPQLLSKFVATAVYFFYLSSIYEVVALTLGWWTFPDNQYLGWVTAGAIGFPLEEFVFWLLLFAMSILAFYETFDDDSR